MLVVVRVINCKVERTHKRRVVSRGVRRVWDQETTVAVSLLEMHPKYFWFIIFSLQILLLFIWLCVIGSFVFMTKQVEKKELVCTSQTLQPK